MLFKIGVLKNFVKFHWKIPVLESLFNKVSDLQETPTLVFSCEYCENFKNSFIYRTTPVAASVYGLNTMQE